jgi:hypothetical protein
MTKIIAFLTLTAATLVAAKVATAFDPTGGV